MFDFHEYIEAESLHQALSFLAENDNRRIIAGGSDVLVKIREGELAGSDLLSIHRIDELKKISIGSNGDIHIGPMVNFTQLEENEIIRKHVPYLGSAGGTVGGPQLRNVATIGGNICNGATSADSVPILLCLNAHLKLRSLETSRIVPLAEFHKGPGKVDIAQGEILTEIIIRKDDYQDFVGKYIKFSQRNAMDIATLGCAVLVKIEDEKFKYLRLAYGVAAPTPVRCPRAEAFAYRKEISEDNIEKISQEVLEDIQPRDSWRGSKAFRQQLAKVLAYRIITELTLQGGESSE